MENLKEKIILVLTGDEEEKILYEVLKNVKYIELRIDEFLRNFNESDIIEWIKKTRKLGGVNIIGTIRWYKEGGENSFYLSDKKRLEIFRAVSNYIDIIDVEIKSKICDKVIEICKSKNKKIILSYHNFKKTPDINILKKIVKKGKKDGADMVKIATKVLTEKHLFTLTELSYNYSKKIGLIVIPMATSLYKRLIPLFFGSSFTYVALNKKTAPSQPSYLEISKFIDLIEIH
ncbi:MAG TPA: type I 3-dehydroquinate dehydratase [bacterium]|nr:type I 3-dehydroquinate dehydratase [bacterium]HOM27324.1 type I 3-dehydroquinate dehydratase [bacterium]